LHSDITAKLLDRKSVKSHLMFEKPFNSPPTIPASECRQRWDKVQGLMAELDLDFLIA